MPWLCLQSKRTNPEPICYRPSLPLCWIQSCAQYQSLSISLLWPGSVQLSCWLLVPWLATISLVYTMFTLQWQLPLPMSSLLNKIKVQVYGWIPTSRQHINIKLIFIFPNWNQHKLISSVLPTNINYHLTSIYFYYFIIDIFEIRYTIFNI